MEDDFEKYNGDGKFAIPSKLVFEPTFVASIYWVDVVKEVVVTGKMMFVKDATGTSETCGIIAGNIFEISEIE